MGQVRHISNSVANPNKFEWTGTALFYLGYGLYIIIALLDNSNLNEKQIFLYIDNLFKIIPLALLITASILSSWRNVKAALLSVMALLPGLLSYYFSKDGAFFWLTLCLISCRGAKLEELARISLVSTCFATLIVLMAWLSGLIPQTVDWNEGVARYSLGFSTPNRCANTMLAAYIAYGTLTLRKNDGKEALIIGVLLMCTSFILTHSRTTVAIFVLSIFTFAAFRFINKVQIAWKRTILCGLAVLVGICILASVLMAYVYTSKNSIMSVINDALSQRISYARMYTEHYSVTLFGMDFSNAPLEYGNGRQGTHFLVDNAYVHLLLRFGLIPFVIFTAAMIAPILLCGTRGKWNATALGLFIMAIFGISETNVLYAETNFFLISGVSLIINISSPGNLSNDTIRGKREKVLFCYGEFDGVKCGVADYSRRLCVELLKTGDVIPITAYQGNKLNKTNSSASREADGVRINSWKRATCMARLALQAKKIGCTTIHIQYPAIGYGRSAAIALLPVAAKLLGLRVVYTVHEFSIFSWKGKVKQLPCMLLADKIIVVDIDELNQIKHIGVIKKKLKHIPIAPNIPKASVSTDQRNAMRRDLVDSEHKKAAGFFGFINESKYILELVEALALLKQNTQLASKLVIIGELNHENSYHRKVLERIHDLGLEDDIYITGYLGAQQASNYIACCDFMLLPTSHGAAERNSSFLACYQNGVPVVTSKPKGSFFYKGVRFFQSDDARSFAEAILLMQTKTEVMECYQPVPSWKKVAYEHIETYKSVR